MLRRRLVGKAGSSNSFEGIDPSEAPALSIVFYNRKTDNLVIAPEIDVESYPYNDYSPIGIVVIPAAHGVLRDNSGIPQCGVMSLTCMSPSRPEIGDPSGVPIMWGYRGQFAGMPYYQGIVEAERAGALTPKGIWPYGYIPCQEVVGSNAMHSMAPFSLSPYVNMTLNTGDFNPNYSILDNSVTHDFDGVNNTKILTDLSTAYNWRTSATITNSNTQRHYPAACCCARFHTEGTKAFKDCSAEEIANGRGFWYLPSAGEIGYLAPRIKDINELLDRLDSSYGIDRIRPNIFNGEYPFWVSSEYDGNNAWSYTLNGYVNYTQKNYTSIGAIAFMRL